MESITSSGEWGQVSDGATSLVPLRSNPETNLLNNLSSVIPDAEKSYDRYIGKLKSCRHRARVYLTKCCNMVKGVYLRCKLRTCINCRCVDAMKYRAELRAVVMNRGVCDKPNKMSVLMLSLRNFPVDKLEWGIDYFSNCLDLLTRRKIWVDNVVGWFWVREVTVEKEYDENGLPVFHVHLHILMENGYMDQRELSDAWEEIVGREWVGRYIRIQRVKNTYGSIRYVTKYLTKHVGLSDIESFIYECASRGNPFCKFGGEWIETVREVRADVPAWKLKLCHCIYQPISSDDWQYEYIGDVVLYPSESRVVYDATLGCLNMNYLMGRWWFLKQFRDDSG